MTDAHETTIAWGAAFARRAYLAGSPPSRIVRDLLPELTARLHYYNSIVLTMVFRDAFGLTLPECKGADEYWHPFRDDPVDDAIDGYLMPLIERNRPNWDHP